MVGSKTLNICNIDYTVFTDGTVINNDSGKIIIPHIDSCGYKVINVGKGENRSKRYIHRLLAECFIKTDGDITKLTVNHKDYNKLNNNINNLEWITREENASHSYKNKKHKQIGDSNYNSKLSRDDVVYIKKNLLSSFSDMYIAKIFGVSNRTIYDIRNNKTWKHVEI